MKKTRILSVFLSLILLAGVLTPAPAQALGQGLTQSQSSSQNGPQIPGARADGITSLNDYDPERDGYFAYLPISYYDDPMDPATSEVLSGELPVIVWNKKIFVRAMDLSRITNLICDEIGDKVYISWWDRHLSLTLGQNMASFVLGNIKDPYLQDRFPLRYSPFQDENSDAWVPLTDVCTIMGVDLIARQKKDYIRYLVNPPQRDVYDVLADLYNNDRREAYTFTYSEEALAHANAEFTSRSVLTLDGIWNRDFDYTAYAAIRTTCILWDYLERYNPPAYIWDRIAKLCGFDKDEYSKGLWDRIIAENLLQRLWFGTENEAVEKAETVVDVTSSEIGLLFFNEITDTVLSEEDKLARTVEMLEENFKNVSSYMSQKTSLKYQELLSRYERMRDYAGPKWKILNAEMTTLTVILKTGLAFVGDMNAYMSRDQLLDGALDYFMKRGSYAYLSSAAVEKLQSEYEGLTSNPTAHNIQKALWESLSETIISAAVSAGLGVASIIADGFTLALNLIPAYQEVLDSMLSYQTSLMAIVLQRETGASASGNDAPNALTLQGEALNQEMLKAYLFVKSCATARELAHEVFNVDKIYLNTLFRDMTLLEYTYGLSEDARPLSYAERIKALTASDIQLYDQVTPLYVSVSGKVLTWGDEKPVPNALIEVTTENDQPRLDFTADGDGAYRAVNIPIFWPEDGIVEKFDPNFQIRLRFSSEEIEGEDEKHFTFRPKAEKEVDDAHLLQMGSLQTTVVDKESGDPISGAGYRLELANPEIYEGKIEVKVNWGGRSDDAGQVLEEKLPPGLYRATFWADGYESAQAAFEVRSGEVTRLSKVELKKKAVWLIVEEDYQDIANDGLWSVHLYYSYDEKGRLTEIGGERAAQHYRHYAYDENGLVTEQIEGSTGGFWTGRKYSYDELGRVIRIDSYLLMNADDWRDASWQENGYQTKRYEGENLAETGYYSDRQTLSYSYTYEYNEAGLLVKEVEWSDGKADRGIVYEYDEQGRLIKSTSSSGRIITVTYEYNEAGQLSKETNLYSEYVTLYFYDEHGNMIREERYSRLGKKLASRTTYTYKQFPFED